MPDDPTGSPTGEGAPSAPPAQTGGPSVAPQASPGNGATPPLGGPAAQAVQPMGLVVKAQAQGALVMQLLNSMLQAFHPSDQPWKDIAESAKKLSKHFPAASNIPQPKMNTGNAASQMPMPPMAGGGGGGGNMSGGPLAAMAQRGPIPGAPQA